MTVDSPASHPHKLRLVPIPPPPPPLPPEPREFDHPITTIAQAERFFRAMGCSRFFMDRSDYPERYWVNPGMQERRLEALARLEATQRFCGIWFDG